MNSNQTTYLDGKFLDAKDAVVSVSAPALHYSLAAFEGIRGNWNDDTKEISIFRLKEHYERLIFSSNALHIKVKEGVDELCEITKELVKRCGYKEDIYIRPITFKGGTKVGSLQLHKLSDSIAIIVTPFGDYIDSEGAISCVTSRWQKPTPESIPTNTKVAAIYMSSVLAKTEAVLAGYDEAILLNSSGTVSEGSGENLFAKIDSVFVTPPVEDGCLGGITRSTVIQISKELFGEEIVERSISPDDLKRAEEVFLTGTAAHVTAVGKIDNRSVGSGEVGEFTKKLQQAYRTIISGRSEDYLHWCERVKV